MLEIARVSCNSPWLRANYLCASFIAKSPLRVQESWFSLQSLMFSLAHPPQTQPPISRNGWMAVGSVTESFSESSERKNLIKFYWNIPLSWSESRFLHNICNLITIMCPRRSWAEAAIIFRTASIIVGEESHHFQRISGWNINWE